MLARHLPMLAVPAAPFDSSEYSFEVKWNGIRALAAVEPGRLRLWGRERAEYTDRYPELDVLRRLPAETPCDPKPDLRKVDSRPLLTWCWAAPCIRPSRYSHFFYPYPLDNRAPYLLPSSPARMDAGHSPLSGTSTP